MSVNNQTFHLVYDTLYNITIQLKPDCLSIIFIPHIDILNQTSPTFMYENLISYEQFIQNGTMNLINLQQVYKFLIDIFTHKKSKKFNIQFHEIYSATQTSETTTNDIELSKLPQLQILINYQPIEYIQYTLQFYLNKNYSMYTMSSFDYHKLRNDIDNLQKRLNAYDQIATIPIGSVPSLYKDYQNQIIKNIYSVNVNTQSVFVISHYSDMCLNIEVMSEQNANFRYYMSVQVDGRYKTRSFTISNNNSAITSTNVATYEMKYIPWANRTIAPNLDPYETEVANYLLNLNREFEITYPKKATIEYYHNIKYLLNCHSIILSGNHEWNFSEIYNGRLDKIHIMNHPCSDLSSFQLQHCSNTLLFLHLTYLPNLKTLQTLLPQLIHLRTLHITYCTKLNQSSGNDIRWYCEKNQIELEWLE